MWKHIWVYIMLWDLIAGDILLLVHCNGLARFCHFSQLFFCVRDDLSQSGLFYLQCNTITSNDMR